MLENLGTALQITVIGMGLVFGAIILLWGVMALLVRLTTEKQPPPRTPQVVVAHPVQQGDTRMLKRRAAAAAVAMALREHSARKTLVFAPQSGQAISPWQAALRGREIESRGRMR